VESSVIIFYIAIMSAKLKFLRIIEISLKNSINEVEVTVNSIQRKKKRERQIPITWKYYFGYFLKCFLLGNILK